MAMLANNITMNMGYGRDNTDLLTAMKTAAYRGYMRAIKEASGQTNVNVTLQGDAGKIFDVVRKEDGNYRKRNGHGAFAY